MVPPPPGRLTTLTVTSTRPCFWNRRWISRAVRSLVPPGALGAIRVIGRVGFHASCASAGLAQQRVSRTSNQSRFITSRLTTSRRIMSRRIKVSALISRMDYYSIISGRRQSMRLPILIAALAILGAHGAAAFAAEAWPARPIRVIVPFPPGGSNDIVARMVGAQLTDRMGKTVVVDNRGGAGGRIGYETAAGSQPDGYTLLVISAAYAFTPALHKLNFAAEKAFVPIAMLGTGANSLAVFPGVPANSVKELVAMAKAKPGQMHYASAGMGTFQHLGSELFRIMAGIDIVNVPFKGGGPA